MTLLSVEQELEDGFVFRQRLGNRAVELGGPDRILDYVVEIEAHDSHNESSSDEVSLVTSAQQVLWPARKHAEVASEFDLGQSFNSGHSGHLND